MEDRSIYISGPIGNKGKCTNEEIIKNVQAAEEIYGMLIKRGWNPECPHLSYYPDKRWREENIRLIDHSTWMELDRQKVWKNKYFFYMEPSIYGDSVGALMELQWAKQWGKKIFTNIDYIPIKLEVIL